MNLTPTHKNIDGETTAFSGINDQTKTRITVSAGARDISGNIVSWNVSEEEIAPRSSIGYCRELDEFTHKTVGSFFRKVIKFNIISGLIIGILGLIYIVLKFCVF